MIDMEKFLKECKEVRDDFVGIVGKYSVGEHLKLRTEVDSLLIMYDQLCEQVARVRELEAGILNAFTTWTRLDHGIEEGEDVGLISCKLGKYLSQLLKTPESEKL